MPRQMLMSLFHAMLQSKISYLIHVWYNCTRALSDQVQIVQNAALRAIFSLDRRSARVDMFRDVAKGVLPVQGMREQAVQRFVYTAQKSEIYTNLRFELGSGQNARRNKHLVVPRVHSQLGESSMSHLGPKLFNKLPLNVRDSCNLKAFKSGCREEYRNRIEEWLH